MRLPAAFASFLYMRPRTLLFALLPLLLLLPAGRSRAGEGAGEEGRPTDPAGASQPAAGDTEPDHTGAGDPADADPADANPTAAQPRLHIHRRSGLPPPDEASMRAWHRRYADAAAPVKTALAELLAARERHHRPAKLTPHCRRLAAAMEGFWREAARRRVLPVADAAADLHLKRLYLRLDEVAETCLGGRWAETGDRLRRAGLAYRQAELALGRWDVAP